MIRRRLRLGAMAMALALGAGLACSSTSSSEAPIPDRADSEFVLASDAFAFENFASGYADSRMTNDLVVRLFGADRVCASHDAPCTTLTPSADTWMTRVNAGMSGGRCEGFAVLSSLFFVGALKPAAFGAPAARELAIDGNVPLQRELAYWFATQGLPVTTANTKKLGAKDALRFLASFLKPGGEGGEYYRIGMAVKSGKALRGAHAVTPLRYEKVGASKYLVHVYDNNYPSEDRTLTIDTAKNRWEYRGSSNPEEAAALYFGDPTNKNLLYFAPVKDRLGVQSCPFCPGAEGMQVEVQGANVTATDAQGHRTTVKDGETEEGAGASVTPSFGQYAGQATTWTNDSPIRIALPGGDVKLEISGRADAADGTASVAQFGSGFSVEVANLVVDATHTDTLTVSADGAQVAYTSTSGTAVSLTSAVTTASGDTVRVSIAAPAGATNVTAAVDPATGDLKAKADNTEGKDVTLTVSYANAKTGTTQTGTVTTKGSDGGTLSASPSAWQPDTPLVVNQDRGDGSAPVVLADACGNGVLDGKETDVDCGGSCPTKCGLAKACGVASDCASGACNVATKRCVASACEDGAKGDGESDVDCGGVCATRCASGNACAGGGDCASGICSVKTLTCVASACEDGVKDGTETDVDCGGSCAARCLVGATCSAAADCASAACHVATGKCVGSPCLDGAKDGAETDVDCGGTCATKCAVDAVCAGNADCESGYCSVNSLTCVDSSCLDGQKDGDESDVDCGGTCARKCGYRQGCGSGADCYPIVSACRQNACDTPDRTVFVSSTTYTGVALGGPDGADARCQELAFAVGLLGTFRAALVKSGQSLDARMSASPGSRYVLVDGTVVANDRAGFVSRDHLAPIQVTEAGTTLRSALVWTGLGPSLNPDLTCVDWTLPNGEASAGFTDFTDYGWASFGTATCNGARNLYCVQQ